MLVYTTGYSGQRTDDGKPKVAALKNWIESIDAVLLDIRLSPRSMASCWRKRSLEDLLGDRYCHVPELGNVNYKNGSEIQIQDMEAGVRKVIAFSPQPVILMCGCDHPTFCHRTEVGNTLRDTVPLVEQVIEIANWGIGRNISLIAECRRKSELHHLLHNHYQNDHSELLKKGTLVNV